MTAPSLPTLLVSRWEVSWWLDLNAALAAGLYLWAAARRRPRWPGLRSASFLAGVGCVLVALQSGVGAYDDRLLSVHMVQHMLLLLVAPALLLAGDPVTLGLRALPRGRRPRAAAWLRRARGWTRPVVCLIAFDIVLLGTHLPAFYDAALAHPALHDAEHLLYLAGGLLLYWPLLGAEPAPSRRLGGLGRLLYMLAAMPAMALIGAYLNRHATVVYDAYGPPSRGLGVSALADQAQAGAIMWVAGSVVLTALGIYAALAGLAEEERRQRLADARAAAGTAAAPRSPDIGGAA
jgi:putative copper resistance protein D